MRFSFVVSISESGIGFLPEPGTDTEAEEVFRPVATVSSTIVFHSPHAGHLPIHFELSFPQDLQNQTVFVFSVAINQLLSLLAACCRAVTSSALLLCTSLSCVLLTFSTAAVILCRL